MNNIPKPIPDVAIPTANPRLRLRLPFAHRIEFLADPLELLNLGNAFDTCMRLNGGDGPGIGDEPCILAYATNANYRVIAVRATDGRILARRVVGLCIDETPGVLQCAVTYPQGEDLLGRAIDRFLVSFVSEADLPLVYSGQVRETCAPAYNLGWLCSPRE